MELNIIESRSSYGGLDINVEVVYYVPSSNKFYLSIFNLDSIQQEILEKSIDKSLLYKFIVKKHSTAREYDIDSIRNFVKPEILTQFFREYKINELLK
jgi:hypothetical protein